MTKIVNWCNINTKEDKKDLKPIELNIVLMKNGTVNEATEIVQEFEKVSLISLGKDIGYNYDLIACFEDDKEYTVLYWGHWNDGIV